MKIGVMTPTYNRPDCIRSLVLQMVNQVKPPDLLCIHHNGNKESYQWAIKDITVSFEIIWIHTPEKIEQDLWYAIPLECLIEKGCTHFFWCDHDDFYRRDHISSVIDDLVSAEFDFTINLMAAVLLLKKSSFTYTPTIRFTSHSPGGMSSSMGFTLNFAKELLIDLRKNLLSKTYYYSDQVVSNVTMPKFKCGKINTNTTTYVASDKTVSSKEWVKE